MRKLLNKYCKCCDKNFLTYDREMIFCQDICKFRFKNNIPKKTSFKKITTGKCVVCAQNLYRKNGRFCSNECSDFHRKKETRKNSKCRDKNDVIGVPVTYRELNKRAEKKRVFDRGHAEYYIRGAIKY